MFPQPSLFARLFPKIVSAVTFSAVTSAFLFAVAACTPTENPIQSLRNLQSEIGDLENFKNRARANRDQDPNTALKILSLPEVTRENVQTAFESVAQDLKTVMVGCPQRIWPGYSFKEIDVLLLSEVTEPQIWRASSGKLEKFDESKVPMEAKSFVYSMLKIDGRKAVGIYVSKSDDWTLLPRQLYTLIVHEAFHFFEQPSWTRRNGKRGTIIPIEAAPRYHRRMVYEEIFNYSQDPQKTKVRLGRAAHQHNQWMRASPAEVQSTADSYEGTARYVDLMAKIIAERGCSAPDSELYAIYNAKLADEFGSYFSPTNMRLDSEGYPYGAMTSFILRFEDLVPDWTQKIVTGKTPAEVLFESVGEMSSTDDEEIRKLYEQSALSETKKINDLIGSTIPDYNNKEMLRVQPPETANSGYSPHGFYLPKDLADTTLIPLAQDMIFRGSEWSLSAFSNSVMLTDKNSVCGASGSFYFLVPLNLVEGKRDQLNLDNSIAKGSMAGEFKTDSNGKPWFCGTP